MTRLARPLTTNDIASVAMRAFILKAVTITPLTSPTPRPTATPATMATAGEANRARCAAVTPTSAETAPTDRSMPPATSTSVSAAAMKSVEACWSRMSRRLTLVTNAPLETDSTRNKMRNG